MTDKQSNQIKSWFIFAVAISVGLAFRSTAIAVVICFLTIPLRDRDNEWDLARELAEKYKYLVYPPLFMMAGFAVFLVYRSIVHRTRITLSEIFLPFIFILPVMIVFEYKLFRRNA